MPRLAGEAGRAWGILSIKAITTINALMAQAVTGLLKNPSAAGGPNLFGRWTLLLLQGCSCSRCWALLQVGGLASLVGGPIAGGLAGAEPWMQKSSRKKSNGWLFDLADEILPSCMGNHYKGPY